MTNNSPRLTMADVYATLRVNRALHSAKRRRMENAFNSLWRYSGIALQDIPASMPGLNLVIQSIEPAAHGVKRPTIINMRNLVMHGMKMSGLVPELSGYREHRKPLSPALSLVSSRFASMHEKNTLWSFIHFLNDEDLAPRDANDSTFAQFVKHTAEKSARANQHQLMRATARYWNDVRERCPDLQLQEIACPASRLRRLPYAVTDLPHSFQGHLKAYHAWLVGEDDFAEDARDRPVAESTAGNYLRRVHRAACILVSAGVARDKLTGLDVFFQPGNFKRIRIGLMAVDKSAQLTETFGTLIMLIQAAKFWLNCSPDHVQSLIKEKNKVKKPDMVMTDKNKKLVAQFDDPATLRRLFNTPSEIWKRMKKCTKLSHRTRLAMAQGALGLAILTHMPLRLGNLTDLTFGETIILRPGGTSSIIIPPEATKARRSVEFDIPTDLAMMIIEYFEEIAPVALGRYPEQLFCRTDGVGKGFAQVRYLIQTYFKEYVGFHMNPHAFRHLCAKLILDADPGAHTLVQELLGHKSVETSTAFYAGLSSRRAGRHHHALIKKTMAQEVSVPAPARGRRKQWSASHG